MLTFEITLKEKLVRCKSDPYWAPTTALYADYTRYHCILLEVSKFCAVDFGISAVPRLYKRSFDRMKCFQKKGRNLSENCQCQEGQSKIIAFKLGRTRCYESWGLFKTGGTAKRREATDSSLARGLTTFSSAHTHLVQTWLPIASYVPSYLGTGTT